MAYEEHPENVRARRDADAGRKYHNMSPELQLLEAKVAQLKQQLRDQVIREFPIGTMVTVEDLYHGARFIRGPVVMHGSDYRGNQLYVRNDKTDKVRQVSIHNFIYKD